MVANRRSASRRSVLVGFLSEKQTASEQKPQISLRRPFSSVERNEKPKIRPLNEISKTVSTDKLNENNADAVTDIDLNNTKMLTLSVLKMLDQLEIKFPGKSYLDSKKFLNEVRR